MTSLVPTAVFFGLGIWALKYATIYLQLLENELEEENKEKEDE